MPAGGAGRVVLALGADLGGQLGVQQPTHHRRPTATLLASSPPWRCWRCRPWPGAARRAAQPGWRRPRGQRGGQVASAWRSPPVGVLGGTPDTSHAAGLRRGHRHLNLNKPGDNLTSAVLLVESTWTPFIEGQQGPCPCKLCGTLDCSGPRTPRPWTLTQKDDDKPRSWLSRPGGAPNCR
jgi:hypothetical protein